MDKLGNNCEFETKYKVNGDLQFKFKAVVSNLDYKEFVYAEGPDYYYINSKDDFIRYRKAVTERRSEITLKKKIENSKNNIQRKEVNWRVDFTPKEDIEEGIKMMGYSFNFSIWKACHIYRMKDGTTLVFYTVKDLDNNIDHFIEIELDETKTKDLTKDQAMSIINKYEKLLSPLGITHRNRLSKSLFEMYRK
jgi:hypothetical protein